MCVCERVYNECVCVCIRLLCTYAGVCLYTRGCSNVCVCVCVLSTVFTIYIFLRYICKFVVSVFHSRIKGYLSQLWPTLYTLPADRMLKAADCKLSTVNHLLFTSIMVTKLCDLWTLYVLLNDTPLTSVNIHLSLVCLFVHIIVRDKCCPHGEVFMIYIYRWLIFIFMLYITVVWSLDC